MKHIFASQTMGGGSFPTKSAGPSNPTPRNPPSMTHPPSPTSNPPSVANPPTSDPWFGVTDEEMNWLYDYTFNQLPKEGPPLDEGYETDPGAEYVPPYDEEMVDYTEDNLDDEFLPRNDGVPSRPEGYETDPGAEYATYGDEETVCYDRYEYIPRNDGVSDVSSSDSQFGWY